MSCRTRRSELQAYGTPKIASKNDPIVIKPLPPTPSFYYERSSNPFPAPHVGNKQRDLQMHGSSKNTHMNGFVIMNPLPPPPSHYYGKSRHGSHMPASHIRSPSVLSSHSRILRRVPHDPFLAAHMVCSKNGCRYPTRPAGQVKQQQQKKRRGELQGCGIWNGWTATKYSEMISCKRTCAVHDDFAVTPVLDLSRLPAIPARERFLERRWRQN